MKTTYSNIDIFGLIFFVSSFWLLVFVFRYRLILFFNTFLAKFLIKNDSCLPDLGRRVLISLCFSSFVIIWLMFNLWYMLIQWLKIFMKSFSLKYTKLSLLNCQFNSKWWFAQILRRAVGGVNSSNFLFLVLRETISQEYQLSKFQPIKWSWIENWLFEEILNYEIFYISCIISPN